MPNVSLRIVQCLHKCCGGTLGCRTHLRKRLSGRVANLWVLVLQLLDERRNRIRAAASGKKNACQNKHPCERHSKHTTGTRGDWTGAVKLALTWCKHRAASLQSPLSQEYAHH